MKTAYYEDTFPPRWDSGLIQHGVKRGYELAYCVGIGIKDMVLFELNDLDIKELGGYTPKKGQKVYRYASNSIEGTEMFPLVAFNESNGRIYHLTEEAFEGGEVEFESRGIKQYYVRKLIG